MVKPMVEKSPKEFSVFTRACKSAISGIEKVELPSPIPSALWRM